MPSAGEFLFLLMLGLGVVGGFIYLVVLKWLVIVLFVKMYWVLAAGLIGAAWMVFHDKRRC